MLLVSDLNEKWQALDREILDGRYKVFPPSEDSHPSLFLARTPNSERALVLVPSLEHIDFMMWLLNISLGRYTENQFIVITSKFSLSNFLIACNLNFIKYRYLDPKSTVKFF